MKLSVVIPVFNEKNTIAEILRRVKATGRADEIILIDDGSTDGTRELLRALASPPEVTVVFHEKNLGKGAALRTGFQRAGGDVILVQDADLEYNPAEYPALLEPIECGQADVVYGSRFLGSKHRVTMFWHMVANQLLTFATNILYNSILSDMETGYKVFRADLLKSISLRANRFDFEPEITAKILKRKARVFEIPISFNPREYDEGKKIGLADAFAAVWALLKYRIMD
ncbi:MAG: glycosyltransferase family 2 protein [Anaerolineales bacterium]|nr:glycosyltransferase family 2 protein [Anaerolineales bacterium]